MLQTSDKYVEIHISFLEGGKFLERRAAYEQIFALFCFSHHNSTHQPLLPSVMRTVDTNYFVLIET